MGNSIHLIRKMSQNCYDKVNKILKVNNNIKNSCKSTLVLQICLRQLKKAIRIHNIMQVLPLKVHTERTETDSMISCKIWKKLWRISVQIWILIIIIRVVNLREIEMSNSCLILIFILKLWLMIHFRPLTLPRRNILMSSPRYMKQQIFHKMKYQLNKAALSSSWINSLKIQVWSKVQTKKITDT